MKLFVGSSVTWRERRAVVLRVRTLATGERMVDVRLTEGAFAGCRSVARESELLPWPPARRWAA